MQVKTEYAPPDLAVAAIRLARSGVAVFPCRARSKHPLFEGPGGYKHATTDVERVRRWWQNAPAANLGLPTGELVVIDIDGPNGVTSLAKLEAEYEPLPLTARVATSRGYHAYYDANGQDVPCSSETRLGKGIDVRGRGGYVLAPPSIHPSGLVYEWIDSTPIKPLPAWVAELCQVPEVEPSAGILRGRVDSHSPYGEAALDAILAEMRTAPKGGRHSLLHRKAIRLAQLVADGDLAASAQDDLRAAAIASGLPADQELEHNIKRGIEYGLAHPKPRLGEVLHDTGYFAGVRVMA